MPRTYATLNTKYRAPNVHHGLKNGLMCGINKFCGGLLLKRIVNIANARDVGVGAKKKGQAPKSLDYASMDTEYH